MSKDIHPLEADEFEDLLTDYRAADEFRGARAACDERRRVHGLIVEYVERHYPTLDSNRRRFEWVENQMKRIGPVDTLRRLHLMAEHCLTAALKGGGS